MSLEFEEKVNIFLDLLRPLAQLGSIFLLQKRPFSEVDTLGRLKMRQPSLVCFDCKYLEESVSLDA